MRLLRLQRGWTQPELAERVGVSLNAVRSLESGAKSPTLRTVDGVAAALGVEAWSLLVPLPDEGAPVRARTGRRRRA